MFENIPPDFWHMIWNAIYTKVIAPLGKFLPTMLKWLGGLGFVAATIVAAVYFTASGLRADISDIEGRLDSMERRLDAVEGRLDAVEGRLDAVEDKLDSVEDKLDAIYEHLLSQKDHENRKDSI